MMNIRLFLLTTLTTTTLTPTVSAAAFEWAGTFALADPQHVWSMQAVGGSYVDPSMRLVVYATTDTSSEGIESIEAAAETLFATACTLVPEGGTLGPFATTGACFELVNDQAKDDSLFSMDTTGLTGMVVFAQHVPTEFERDRHYLQDSAGTDIEPVAQESGGDGHDHAHDHGDDDDDKTSCACVAAEFNFNIDCAATAAMTDSLSFLKTNGCATDCSSDNCREAWSVVQTHHDYCTPDELPSEIEDDFHDFDETCTSCAIARRSIDGAPTCPSPNCEDESGNEAYVFLVENGCATACATTPACADNYLTLRTVHDGCDHDVLSTTSEEGLHDFEDPCGAVVCNAAGSEEDQLTCQSTTSGVAGVTRMHLLGEMLVGVIATAVLLLVV